MGGSILMQPRFGSGSLEDGTSTLRKREVTKSTLLQALKFGRILQVTMVFVLAAWNHSGFAFAARAFQAVCRMFSNSDGPASGALASGGIVSVIILMLDCCCLVHVVKNNKRVQGLRQRYRCIDRIFQVSKAVMKLLFPAGPLTYVVEEIILHWPIPSPPTRETLEACRGRILQQCPECEQFVMDVISGSTAVVPTVTGAEQIEAIAEEVTEAEQIRSTAEAHSFARDHSDIRPLMKERDSLCASDIRDLKTVTQ